MNKYLNIIIVSFFSILICRYEIGLLFIIPIFLIYLLFNSKLLIIFIPLSLLSGFIYNKNMLICLTFMFVLMIIYIMFFQKKNSTIVDIVYVILLNIACYYVKEVNINDLDLNSIIGQNNNIRFIMYAFLSSIIFVLLKYLVKKIKGNFKFFELIPIALSIIGAITIDIKVSFALSVFYAMYFTSSTNVYVSIIFESLCFVYLYYFYKVDYAVVLPFIAILYMNASIISSFLLVILLTIIITLYPEYISVGIIINIVTILFELLKNKMITKRIKKSEVIKESYENGIEALNRNVLAFSSFLDNWCQDGVNNKHYYKRIDESVNSLICNYCEKCYVKGKCNKSNLKSEMQDLIINCKDIKYDYKDSKALSVCPYNVEMRKSAILIKERLEESFCLKKNNSVNQALSGISNILRQFIVENNIHKEINYNDLYKVKKGLVDDGYNICYFKCEKTFEDDFLIEVGVRGHIFEYAKEDILKSIEKSFKKEISLEYSQYDCGKDYFRIIPKTKCRVEFGSSNIATGTYSGDNVYVSDTADGKAVAIICDGMGKGYKASVESGEVMKMVEELLKSSMSSYGIVQIINTFCSITDSIDNYCTLDYLELNRKSNEITFYKMSSAPSFIFRKDERVEKVENKRLPLGKESDIISESILINPGDVIIMSSDGLFENVDNEKELQSFIKTITHLSPERIVCQILEYVKSMTKYVDDDISLVVMKVLPC